MTSSNSDRKPLGEFQRIAKFFAPLSGNAQGAFGLTDDAARLRVKPGRELIVTTDALVEGVHFFRDDPAGAIAQKALRVNLSDLAAKGAEPEAYLLALSLPGWADDDWLAGFAGGLSDDQTRFGISLIGGDTTSTPGPLTLAITAMGSMAEGHMLLRSGARPGDVVFVSGTIGDAGAGLAIRMGRKDALAPADRDFLLARYRLPEPRLALGRALAGCASAALDVSDGLVGDLGHVADTSGVRIVVEANRVPLSAAYSRAFGGDAGAVLGAATAGDDYEIAFTAPRSARDAVRDAAAQAGVAVSEIGRVEEGAGVVLLDSGGRPIPVERPGFTHF
jgi:thiamine-monophosphate kinase